MKNVLKVRGAAFPGLRLGTLALLFFLLHNCAVAQTPTLLGDLDTDRTPTVIDLQQLLNHINAGTNTAAPGILVSSLVPYADINEDGRINTNDVLLLQDAILGRRTLPNPYAAPVVSVPTFSTNGSSVIITGTARPNRRIIITGGRLAVFANSDSNGLFTAEVQLRANQVNAIYVTATNATFTAGIPQPLRVLQDSQPPNLFIDFPTNGATLYTDSTVVAGRVGDSLSGFLGLTVRTRSTASQIDLPAVVDVGIGNNGTYQRSNFPLEEGTNVIRVTATDIHGNQTNRELTVIRRPLAGPRLLVLSGDGQKTNVHRRIADPIIVKATQADGVTPLANTLVTFEVTRSDGRLRPAPPSVAADASRLTNDINATPHGIMSLQMFTDANGIARAYWAMGGDAGCGNNRVCVMSAGISNAVYFCASADAALPKQINIGTGNNQKAETGGFLPEPLRAWVNDSCNGNQDMPVTFTVVQGGGRLYRVGDEVTSLTSTNGDQSLLTSTPTSITVPTTRTGHAEVLFQLGPDAGQNIVEANYPGNTNLPATFIAYGVARDPSKPTTLTGLLLDNTSQPIGGATMRVSVGGRSFTNTTDVQGRFVFPSPLDPSDLPSGPTTLTVNGSTATNLLGATIPTNSFPSLEFSLILIPNAENSLPSPVLLPKLNLANQRLYYGTNDLVLTCEGMEGLKMTIKAGSMKKPDGTLVTPSNPSFVSLNQVHHDNVPMPIPDGASPPFAWTLQPGGATFDPPVQVEYPNMSGLPAGTIAYFLSFNHDTRRFEIICSGHVREDSATIVSDPGAGLTIAGWGCNCPPYAATGSCDDCESGSRRGRGRRDETDCQKCNCEDHVGLDYKRATLEDVARAFRLLPLYRGGLSPFDSYAAGHLNQFLAGSGIDNYYRDGDDPVEDIKSHPNFQAKHELLLQLIQSLAGSEGSLSFIQQLGGIKFYNGGFEWNQLANGVGQLSEGYTVDVSVSFGNGKITGAAHYSMRDHYYFDKGDCSLSKYDGMGCCLEKCGAAKGFYNHFDFSIPIDITVLQQRIAALAGIDERHSLTNELRRNEANLLSRFGGGVGQSFDFSVNGQTLQSSREGYLFSDNISAPDQFGPGGPGTPPDFVSDDYVRVLGVSTVGGTNRYAKSEYFKIRQGQTTFINNLEFGDVPPDKPESLTIICTNRILRVGEPRQLEVMARYANGNTTNVSSSTRWTSYRVSNPSIATVSDDGIATALNTGLIYITAVNEGVAAVCGLTVVAATESLTTVTGTVVDTNGVPIAGATVRVYDLEVETVTTDASGTFTISSVPTSFGPLTIGARVLVNGRTYTAVARVSGVPGGTTSLGSLIAKAPTALSPTRFAVGTYHTVGLRADGTLWAWGGNDYGQLGNGTFVGTSTPQSIRTNETWLAVAVGDQHTVALKADGTLWAWGAGALLGNGEFVNANTPQPIRTDETWQAVAAGTYHSVALRGDGTLWAWGENDYGQLGNGTFIFTNKPQPILASMTWQAVAGGAFHSAALRTDGTLWAWGRNDSGQLGNGTFVRANTPQLIQTNETWQAVAAGVYHTVALRADRTLWTWGGNGSGQLGNGRFGGANTPQPIQTNETWQAVAAGIYHTVALRADGTLWAWGDNNYGQLGNGRFISANTPQPILTNETWQAVAAGDYYTMALRADGTLWAWGQYSGRLGNGTLVSVEKPQPIWTNLTWQSVAAGANHTLALRADGTLWAWGRNDSGQLGSGTPWRANTPQPILTNWTWQAVAAGGEHTVALRADGTLWAWGTNSVGQLGNGTFVSANTPQPSLTNVTWQAVAAGKRHTVALRNDRTLWAWGDNSYRQLGNGTSLNANTPQPILTNETWQAVTAGGDHTVALRADGTLWTWGRNDSGQLGNGTFLSANAPAPILTNMTWQAMAAGGAFTMALRADGTLWAWGRNDSGQLGNGTFVRANTPQLILTNTTWRSVVAGGYSDFLGGHTLALRGDGTLWAWGNNTFGQLGNGTFTRANTPQRLQTNLIWQAVAAGGDHSVALRADGTLWGWGYNSYGQIAQPVPWLPYPVLGGAVWGAPRP